MEGTSVSWTFLRRPKAGGKTPHLGVHHLELATAQPFQGSLATFSGLLQPLFLSLKAGLGLLAKGLGLVDPTHCPSTFADPKATCCKSGAGKNEGENH